MRTISKNYGRRGIAPLLIILGVAAVGLLGYEVYKMWSDSRDGATYNEASTDASTYDTSYDYAYAPASGTATSAAPADGRAEFEARLLAKFDADGDGTLSDTEREASREQFMLERFDADGDGALSDAERATAEKARPPRGPGGPGGRGEGRGFGFGPDGSAGRSQVLTQFDADGDGKLSDTEREAARTAREALRADPDLQALAEALRTAHTDLVTTAESGAPEALLAAKTAFEQAKTAFEAKRTALLAQD